MRKVILLILFFLASAVFSLQAEEYDFRETRWGMSVKEVRASEGSRLLIKEGGKKEYRLVYSTSIADLEGSDGIPPKHLSEAVQYRTLDRTYWT